jgi:hypothetical protein
MTPTHEHESGEELGQLVELAIAIAEREQIELDYINRAVASDLTQVPLGDPQGKALLDSASRHLLRLQQPHHIPQIDTVGITESHLTKQYDAHIQQIWERFEGRYNIEQVAEAFRQQMTDIQNVGGRTAAQSAADFAAMHESALFVADMYFVTPEEVYRTDELFFESVRRTYTIEAFAEQYVVMMGGFTVSRMRQSLLAAHVAMTPSGENVDEYLNNLSAQQSFNDTAVIRTLEQRRVAAASAKAQMERVWGQQEMSALPEPIRRKLSI